MACMNVSIRAAADVRFDTSLRGIEGSGQSRGVHSKAVNRIRPTKPITIGTTMWKVLQLKIVPPQVKAMRTETIAAMNIALPK